VIVRETRAHRGEFEDDPQCMQLCLHKRLRVPDPAAILKQEDRTVPGTKKKQRKKKAAPRAAARTSADDLRQAVKNTEVLTPARAKVGGGAGTSAAALRSVLRLSRQDFARLTGFSVRKIADLEKGVATKASTDQRLAELSRLQQGLSGIMDAEFVGEWLRMPNDAFGGLKPMEVIERGEVDRLWRMIYLLEAGLPV
jgi:DNA-binding transcriptional regulator YiaG